MPRTLNTVRFALASTACYSLPMATQKAFPEFLTGPEFKQWADETGVDRKIMADELGISTRCLLNWFARASIPRYIAMGIKWYAQEKRK